MRQATDLDDFLAAPRGTCLASTSFAFFNLGTVCGWRGWGQPTREDARVLVAAIDTAYAPGAPPYFSLVDLRALEGVDGAGFEVLHDWVKGHRDQMASRLTRQAVVRPTGLVGAFEARPAPSGFTATLRASSPTISRPAGRESALRSRRCCAAATRPASASSPSATRAWRPATTPSCSVAAPGSISS